MICKSCGGLVEWKGPLVALTHTECLSCGAVNNQEPEDETPVECEHGCDEETCRLCAEAERR